MNTQLTPDTSQGAPCNERCVIAAVRPGTSRLAEIVKRAQARAAQDNAPVVFVTICTRRPIGDELPLMRSAMLRAGVTSDLVMSWSSTDGLPRSQHATVVADQLADAARRLQATAIVIGYDPAVEPARQSILARLTTQLSPATDLLLGAEIDAAAGDSSDPVELREFPYSRGVYLTESGRERLSRRRHTIERNELPRLRHRIRQHPTSRSSRVAFEAVLNDLRVLNALIDLAPSTSEIPDDPQRVELGESVALAGADAAIRTVTVVSDIEAGRGRHRVAASSPLGRAVLGRRVGEWTTIPTRRGPQPAKVLAATR